MFGLIAPLTADPFTFAADDSVAKVVELDEPICAPRIPRLSPDLVTVAGSAGGNINVVCLSFFWPLAGVGTTFPFALPFTAEDIVGIALIDIDDDGRGRSLPLPFACAESRARWSDNALSPSELFERVRWKPMLVLGRE